MGAFAKRSGRFRRSDPANNIGLSAMNDDRLRFEKRSSRRHERKSAAEGVGTGGEVANAQVCKTCIRGFKSRPVLQIQDPLGGKLIAVVPVVSNLFEERNS